MTVKKKKSQKEKPQADIGLGVTQKNNDGFELSLPKDRGDVKLELMAPDFPLVRQLLESYLDDWKRDPKHGKDKQNRRYFYFTDVDKCPRRVFYDFTQAEKRRDMKAETMMMFTFGDLFHDEIQNRLRRMGATTNKHIEFGMWENKGLPFNKSGRLDVFLRAPEDGSLLIVADIKSKDEFSINMQPSDDEVDQLMSYIDAAKVDKYLVEQEWKIADYGFLIYVTRREIRFWKVELSAERTKVIEEEFKILWTTIEKGQLPTRPYIRDSVQCQYCRYLEYCWEGVPAPEVPKLEPDATITPPSQEIVESMAKTFLNVKKQIKELEKQEEIAERTLDAYFRSMGVTELRIDDRAVEYVKVTERSINVEWLKANVKPEIWPSIAKPGIALMEKAVKDKIIDGTTFERAVTKGVKYQVREKKASKKETS